MGCNPGTPLLIAANRTLFKSVNKENEAGAVVMTAWVTEPLLSRGIRPPNAAVGGSGSLGKGSSGGHAASAQGPPPLYGETRSSCPPFQHPEYAPRRPGAWPSRHQGRRWRSRGTRARRVSPTRADSLLQELHGPLRVQEPLGEGLRAEQADPWVQPWLLRVQAVWPQHDPLYDADPHTAAVKT